MNNHPETSAPPPLWNHYPRWLRAWHWTNAVLFLILAASGVSLHFAAPSAPLLDFSTARVVHNLCGIAFTLNFLVFGGGTLVAGNWIHYRPRLAGLPQRLIKMGWFYGVGIFRGEPLPFSPTATSKFNPLQQLTYLGVMAGGVPLVIATGWLLLFPEFTPERFLEWDGVWPVAVLHYLVGVFLILFMCGHLYLATCGTTVFAEFRKMLFGEEHH